MIKKCKICGKEFSTKYSRKVYCSQECAKEGARRTANKQNEKRRHPLKPRKCEICGKEFKPRNPSNIFCSKECAKKGIQIYEQGRKNSRLVRICASKHDNCFSCDMPVGECRYD